MSEFNEFIEKDGKRLRLGYTTGSCAAAAAKAAAWMLLFGKRRNSIGITTAKGIPLELDVLDISIGNGEVSCAVRKDSGDDPDVTNETLIYAKVSLTDEAGIIIDGGQGIGRVTKRGLDQPVGNAAINSVPRQMIHEGIEEVMRLADYRGGFKVIISCPDGERIAKKTFNPRLGIVGGISILGTTGIVEPMSEKALVDTIHVELNQRRASGFDEVLLTPGNYGSDFIKDGLGIDPERAVQTSNFIGDSIDICGKLGFKRALLVGHIGKLVKIAGGMMNTHSKYGDCRMEIIAAHAGASGAPASVISEILQCAACDDAVRILREFDGETERKTLKSIADRIHFNLNYRAGEELKIEAIVFSKEYGVLCATPNAADYIGYFKEV